MKIHDNLSKCWFINKLLKFLNPTISYYYYLLVRKIFNTFLFGANASAELIEPWQ